MAKDSVTPSQLRKAHSVTQTELAGRLNISQPTLAEFEGRNDPQLGTLRRYVRALGGELEIRAVFPDTSFTLDPQAPRKRSRK